MQKKFQHYLTAIVMILVAAGCQKMDRPELGNYPVDANPPTGPLRANPSPPATSGLLTVLLTILATDFTGFETAFVIFFNLNPILSPKNKELFPCRWNTSVVS